MHPLPSTASFGILEDQIYDPLIHLDIDSPVKSDFYNGDWALHRWRTIVPAGLRYDEEYASHWQSRVVSGHDTHILQQIFWSSNDKQENSPVYTKHGGDILRSGIEEWGSPLEAKLPHLAQAGFKLKFSEVALTEQAPAIDEEQHHEEFWPAEEDNDCDLDFDLKQDERLVFVVPRSPSKSPRKSPRKTIEANCLVCERKSSNIDAQPSCCQSCIAHKCHTCSRPTAADDQDEDGDCGACKELGFYEIMYRIILRFEGGDSIVVRWEIALPEMMEAAMNGEVLGEEDVVVLLLEDVSLVAPMCGKKDGRA